MSTTWLGLAGSPPVPPPLSPLTFPSGWSPGATIPAPEGAGEAQGALGAATPATTQRVRGAQLAVAHACPGASGTKPTEIEGGHPP